ncbi:peptidase T [Vibrio methylphosphonaticus]|uniref:peptidase T n=1 Tax=Vibrio methylphosphonaticus TaxID=2946866 RepID=UPI002029BA10|nr:peptidase T [Vibrio methylphosphonaticus]MCL9773962.1 peptidase T [Vibrio methylphosphonaticus]
MASLTDRFLQYVTFDTQSDSSKGCCPSTPGQTHFVEYLKQELIDLGLSNVSLDDNGYLMATLPSNIEGEIPAIGFVAHMDTAPDASGRNVKPQLLENYIGGDIALGKGDEVLSPIQYPDLHDLHGHDIITTDGTTLLGADNKAGIAEIITAVEYLMANPDIPHGDIQVGFTPDEEIGRGANLFNVEKFAADWAYTVDGGPVGELEYENFNAAAATVEFTGVSVHPGTAKGKLVNAMTLASRFHAQMPSDETPEATQGYEGFYHLGSADMSVAKSTLHYIVRDFESEGLARRKAFLQDKVASFDLGSKRAKVSLQLVDNYSNMREMVAPHPHIIELAEKAMIACDVQPNIKPIRGGTDGARLSFMGLPCPNIFTGGYNFHGIHEFITVQGMELAVKVIVQIAKETAIRYR